MTLIQDVYFSTEFKKSFETNYNFSVPLDNNIDLKPHEKIKFKMVDFSMMNSMLNISAYHKNNQFVIVVFAISYTITIPDGSYTPTSLRDWLNNYMTINTHPLAFNYDKTTNKYWLVTSAGVGMGDLLFYPQNCAALFGFTKPSYQIIYPNLYYSDSFVNMLPYSKIVLSTNLSFNVNVQTNLERRYSATTGTGDIICWIPRDIPLFNTINYTNINNIEIDITNRNIKSINISILNEYQEYILDAPHSLIHFQLIIYDGTNWYKRFYKLINDIAYYLLSSYFVISKK